MLSGFEKFDDRPQSWCSPEPVTQRSELRNTVQVKPLSVNLGSDSESSYYGTRTSTALLIRRDGRVLFIERDIWKLKDGKVIQGNKSSDRVFRFQLDST